MREAVRVSGSPSSSSSIRGARERSSIGVPSLRASVPGWRSWEHRPGPSTPWVAPSGRVRRPALFLATDHEPIAKLLNQRAFSTDAHEGAGSKCPPCHIFKGHRGEPLFPPKAVHPHPLGPYWTHVLRNWQAVRKIANIWPLHPFYEGRGAGRVATGWRELPAACVLPRERGTCIWER